MAIPPIYGAITAAAGPTGAETLLLALRLRRVDT